METDGEKLLKDGLTERRRKVVLLRGMVHLVHRPTDGHFCGTKGSLINARNGLMFLVDIRQWFLTWVRFNPRGSVSQFHGFGNKRL